MPSRPGSEVESKLYTQSETPGFEGRLSEMPTLWQAWVVYPVAALFEARTCLQNVALNGSGRGIVAPH